MEDIWADVPSSLKDKFPAEAIFTNPKQLGKSNLFSICICWGEESTPSFKAFLAVIEKRSKGRWIMPTRSSNPGARS
jgi:hypothetical protein